MENAIAEAVESLSDKMRADISITFVYKLHAWRASWQQQGAYGNTPEEALRCLEAEIRDIQVEARGE
jgi:hypothetical protein